MEESRHTPGPWKVQALEDRRHGYDGWSTFAIRDARNVCVATVGDVDRAMSESAAASACLIAAAPELLAMCERALSFMRSVPDADNVNLGDDLAAAIAKVRGESAGAH